jgi:hypothetical protein
MSGLKISLQTEKVGTVFQKPFKQNTVKTERQKLM